MTIEEAFEALFVKAMQIPLTTPAEFNDAARALALAVLEEALGDKHISARYRDLVARIEALGRGEDAA